MIKKLLFCLVFSVPVSAQQDATKATIPQISVGARGEVKVSPDRANLQISVQTRAASAAAAAAENSTKQAAVINALRRLDILAADISTVGYSVQPEYRYEQNREPVVTGYVVTNTVSVELRSIGLAGRAIDAALGAGANMITSLRFYAANTEAARQAAIANAIRKARADAEAAARAAGGRLGSMLEIIIGAEYGPPRPMDMVMLRERAATGAVADTPINPGDQTISVDLTTRWTFLQ